MLQLAMTIMCFDPDILETALAGRFTETVVAEAASGRGPTRVYVSEAGSWTLVQVIGGKACIVAAGTGWVGVPNI